jgi:hypothetical protein
VKVRPEIREKYAQRIITHGNVCLAVSTPQYVTVVWVVYQATRTVHEPSGDVEN